MREWNLTISDPVSLTLAADARLGPTSYYDDQIWELTLAGGEPPALALQTTFGLRVRSLRLFPRFIESDLIRSDPVSFAQAPAIKYFSPNYFQLTFTPFTDIDVTAEIWVPTSQTLAGRYLVANNSSTLRKIRLEMVGLMVPQGEGQRMLPAEISGVSALTGASGGLVPVLFMTGGVEPGTGPYPSLSTSLVLEPDKTCQSVWAHAALNTVEASLQAARETALRNWDAELARIEMLNSGMIEVYSGNSDWDAAFSLSQKVAYGLLVSPTEHLPNHSFVLARQPGHGFSARGDGLDYSYQWSGQTPMDTWYLSDLLLPAAPKLVAGLLKNFFVSAEKNGFIDWKPGPAGQRSHLIATPLLAALAERVYDYTGDTSFLEDVFPQLLAYLRVWFTPEHDRDRDGIPEWTHTLHSGYDEHPLFSLWHTWGQGADISTAETPSLCSFLYNEINLLKRMAELLNIDEPVPSLQMISDNLRAAVEASWDKKIASYKSWDRDSHFTSPGERIGERTGEGRIEVERSFDYAVRLLIKITTESGAPVQPLVFIHGIGSNGQHYVERLAPERFHWYLGQGIATGLRLYSSLEFITIEGLTGEDQVSVSSVEYHYQEHTLLLPLWARIPARRQAKPLIKDTITNSKRYWRAHGLPACPDGHPDDEAGLCQRVYLPWNALIARGLLSYGYRTEAAELVSRLMDTIIPTLKQEGAFRKYYHAETGQGMGESNTVDGLAPLGLFLETLGIRIYSPQKVGLEDFNPFPRPITVKYRGLTVLRQKEKTTVIFPDGQTHSVSSPNPCIVSLE
jgi:hypothetical protein